MNEQQSNQPGALQRAAQAAQFARGIAQTIQGAISGGLYGAAVAAAKAFAPQLIKFLITTLVVLLLLPSILFLSLPSSMFQWNSISASDIEQMNEQAARLAALYNSFDSITQEEAERIIAELSAGFDDKIVDKDLSGVNYYWLIAICSVLYEQDLDTLSEGNVRGLAAQNLDYSYTTSTYEVDTGRTDENGDPITETRTRIHINMRAGGAEALMTKLGFTEFQREWARFIYQNLTDDQLVLPENPEYPTGGLTNYGRLTFTDGSTEVIYYNQTDSRWGNEMYGKTYTIAVAGCGPTALAMVVSSLTDTVITPKEMAAWAYKNGYCAEGNGSYQTLIPEGGRHFGLTVEGASVYEGQKVIDALASGKLVIAIMGPGHFTTCGHFIVLRGVTSDGKILVADPVSVRKSQMEWDFQLIRNETSRKIIASGPFWICS